MLDLKLITKRYEQYKSKDVVTVPSTQAGFYDFDSTQYSINRPLIWPGIYEDKRKQVTHTDRITLIRISNYLEHNFPPYAELLNCIPRFWVGGGIRPRPATTNSDFNVAAHTTWKQWAESRMADVEGVKNFYEFLKFIVKRLVAEGDVYIILTKSANGWPQLQYVSPLRVRSSDDDKDDSIDGVYYSPSGAIVAYNVFDLEDPGDSTYINSTLQTYRRIPAENIICISREDIGHGIPWAQSSFNDMRDLKDVMSSVSNAVKNSAMFTIQYQDTTGKGGPVIVDGMGGQKYKPTGNQAGTLPNGQANPNPLTMTNPKGSIDILNPTVLEQLTTGTKNRIANVGYGELKPVNATIPEVESYVEFGLRNVCQSVGFPYEFVYCPEQLNKAGGDITLDKTKAFIREGQELTISRFCQRVYNWVISVLMDDDEFLVLGDETPYTCQWTPPAKIGAGRNDVTNRVDSIQNHLWNPYLDAEELGKDGDQIMDGQIRYMKRWQERCKEEGVDPHSMVFGKASTFKPLTTATSTTTVTSGNVVTVTTEGEPEDGGDKDNADPADFDEDENEDIDQNEDDTNET